MNVLLRREHEMGTAKSYMYKPPSIHAATAAISCQDGRTPASRLYGFLMPQFRSFKGFSMVWENNPPNHHLQREQDLALGRLQKPRSQIQLMRRRRAYFKTIKHCRLVSTINLSTASLRPSIRRSVCDW